MTTERTYTLTLPPAYARDREFRELDNGKGNWTRRGFVTVVTESQLREMESDADHYADGPEGFERDMAGVCRSAKTALIRIRAAQGVT